MAKIPVLDLQTLVERPVIAIDGAPYEILSPQELSVVDMQRMASAGRELDDLRNKDKLTKAEEKRLSGLLVTLTDRIMVGVPDEVRAKLTDPMREAVAEVFIDLPLHNSLTSLMTAVGANRQARRAKKKAAKNRPTGAKSPPSSKGSTAARRAGGSTKRPSPSSGPTAK